LSAGTLLIRTDANTAIGTGHVMRCIALAQAWLDAGGRADFTMAESTAAIRARIQAESYDAFTIASEPGSPDDLRQTIALMRQGKYEWIAVDGYQFGGEYQRGLKAAGFKILFLDDYGHSDHYSADLVLNQNISAVPELYANREPQTRLLLGPRYALLRREFSAWSSWQHTIVSVCRRVLITMGGSDQANVTAIAIEALDLAKIEELEATVIVGGSNPHLDELKDLVARSRQKITLLKNVSNIGELMAAADIAISAAGTTCWELCLLGLPALLIDSADNQTALAKELHRRGCAIHIGDRTILSWTIAEKLEALAENLFQRQLLSKASRQLVDGKGAMRVVSVLRGKPILRLRPLRSDDRRLLWEWANDPEVRSASFSTEAIPWETHVAWFDEKLRAAQNSKSTDVIFIAEDEESNALGQIRLGTRVDGDWEVDVSVAKPMRGLRLGTELIERSLQEIYSSYGTARVHALIKPESIASLKSFERAGFRSAGTHHVQGHEAIHLIYERI